MDVIEAIRTTGSTRVLKPNPVLRKALRELLYIAGWAPPEENGQPWYFYVSAAKPLAEVTAKMVEKTTT